MHWHSMERYGILQFGMVNNMARLGTAWYSLVWPGMVCIGISMVGYAMVWSVMMTGAARGELQEVTG